MVWDRPSSVLLFELLEHLTQAFFSPPASHIHSRQMTSGILQVSSSPPLRPPILTYCCTGLAPRHWSSSHFVPSLQAVCQSKSPCHQESVHNQQRPPWLYVSRETVTLSLSLIVPSPVYEYPLNGQWIMMDVDDGYILWTGIWKGKLIYFLTQVLVA